MYTNSKKMFRIISINEISIIKTICYLSYKPACYNYSRNTFICLRNVSYKGYFAENFIAQEFICAGMENLYSWNENTAEIEFLIEKNGSILPVEVKSGWITQAKSLKVFDNKYHPEYKIIMSANNLKMNTQNQTLYCPLYNAYQLVDSHAIDSYFYNQLN